MVVKIRRRNDNKLWPSWRRAAGFQGVGVKLLVDGESRFFMALAEAIEKVEAVCRLLFGECFVWRGWARVVLSIPLLHPAVSEPKPDEHLHRAVPAQFDGHVPTTDEPPSICCLSPIHGRNR